MMLSLQFPEFHVTCLTVAEECRSWNLDPVETIRSAGLSVHENTPVLTLSRGELKRLHLACVFSREYDLLLLDEPFSSLDCEEKEKICRKISTLSSGITVLFSHEQSIFPHIDYIWEIHEGALVFCGRVPNAFSRWHHAPLLLKSLIASGCSPRDLTPESLVEAACRTRD
jgi:energy-coupling factor transport system ATP-binding protein